MRIRNQVAKLRHDMGHDLMTDDVKAISDLMDELSGAAPVKPGAPELTIGQLFDQLKEAGNVAESTSR